MSVPFVVTIDTPHIEYSLVAPMLIVFGAATLGVLVEAFAPRHRRYLIQTLLALLGLVAAGVDTVLVARDLGILGGTSKTGKVVAEGALAIDGPALFLWGLVIGLSLLSVLLFAERRLEGGVTAFAGQAAALPGTEAERLASTQGLEHTEVFPLMMFAVAGMMMFPAANDLLTMFVALEVLSLPLYLLCGLARRRRLLSQEAAMKYFLLGAFSSGFFIYGIALVYGYAGSMGFAEIANAVSSRTGGHVLLLGGMGLMAVGLLFKVSAAPFHSLDPRRLPGRSHRGDRLHGRVHEGGRVRRDAPAVLRRLRRRALGLDADVLRGRDPDHGGRLGAGARADRHQAAAGLLLDRARGLPAHRLHRCPVAEPDRRRTTSAPSRPCCSTW